MGLVMWNLGSMVCDVQLRLRSLHWFLNLGRVMWGLGCAYWLWGVGFWGRRNHNMWCVVLWALFCLFGRHPYMFPLCLGVQTGQPKVPAHTKNYIFHTCVKNTQNL